VSRTAEEVLNTTQKSRCLPAAVAACLVFFTLALNGFVYGPSPLAGDDLEYYLCLYTLGTQHNMAIHEVTLQRFLGEFPGVSRRDLQTGLVPFRDDMYDTLHFWGFSALAIPFYTLLKILHANWKLAFALVNGFWFAIAIFIATASRGLRAAALIFPAVLVSPLVAYLSKAHAEMFVVSLELIALYLLLARRYLALAAAVCLLAVEVAAFAPLGALCLLLWAWRARRLGHGLADHLVCFACLLCLAVQPVWNLLRHNAMNLIVARGFVWPDMATPKRMLAMFVDPDVGLLFTWPLAVVLLAAFLAAAAIHRGVVHRPAPFWAFTLLFFLTMPYIQAQQANFTTSAVRYAYWYIPFFLVVGVEACSLPAKPLWPVVTLSGFILLGLAATGFYNLAVRRVQVLRLERTPLAEAFYRHFPWLYDPDRQIFVDISLARQVVNGRQIFADDTMTIPGEPGIWAVSNRDCTKLLVLPAALPSGGAAERPAGCEEPLDAQALLDWLKQSGRLPSRNSYVNLGPESVRAFAPTIATGQILDFASPASGKFLGSGWSEYEPWGRWSSGGSSNLRFRILRNPAVAARGDLKVWLSYVVFARHVPLQRVRCYVNRRLVGTIEQADSMAERQWAFPLPPLPSDTADMLFEIESPVPARWSGVSWRPLGFGLVKLAVLPDGPPSKKP